MAELRRFIPADERRTKRDTRAARQLLLGLNAPADALAMLMAGLDAIDTAAEGWRFMQINGDREAEILAHLRTHAPARHEAAEVLTAVRNALGFIDQRTTKTQAEIGAALGLDRANTARAFRALAAAGAIMNPAPAGRSRTWEVDATFATRLHSDARAAAAAHQARQRAAAAAHPDPGTPRLRLIEPVEP